MEPTPIQTLNRVSDLMGRHVTVKRDDLLPEAGGGNKVRKLDRIYRDYEYRGVNAVVTTGGTDSNHCRVAAILCAQRGWPCTLVMHASEVSYASNLEIAKFVGAKVKCVKPDSISTVMEESLRELHEQGLEPAYLSGGGHEPLGISAYSDAVVELARQMTSPPDLVVVPCGTGGTLAGISMGLARVGWHTNALGISVARSQERASHVVAEAIAESNQGVPVGSSTNWMVSDAYVDGGYARFGPATLDWVRRVGIMEGLLLDPVYTGKAFRGMMESKGHQWVEGAESVLFWHTGGFPNLLTHLYNDPENSVCVYS